MAGTAIQLTKPFRPSWQGRWKCNRSLAIDWRWMKSPDAQITALAGIALAEAALGGEAGRIDALLELLHPKLETLVLADGGHISRMPDRHISLLRKLVEIRMATSHAGADATRLSDVMNRMGAITRLWRHGDGRLVHFNGGGLVAAETIEETLLRAGVRGKPLQQAPYSGFLRLGSGRTIVIMDVGDPAVAPQDPDRVVSLGTLGFEMSIGSTQLVVNPGQTVSDPNMLRIMSRPQRIPRWGWTIRIRRTRVKGGLRASQGLRWARSPAASLPWHHMTGLRRRTVFFTTASCI